jgi:dihydroxyacetone kinase
LNKSIQTSLNMPGFSITLLLLPSPDDLTSPPVETLLSLLDDATDAPGWKWSSHTHPTSNTIPTTVLPPELQEQHTRKLCFPDPKQFKDSIERACKALITAEPEITRYDSIAGDADCGLTLKVCARPPLLGDVFNENITIFQGRSYRSMIFLALSF